MDDIYRQGTSGRWSDTVAWQGLLFLCEVPEDLEGSLAAQAAEIERRAAELRAQEDAARAAADAEAAAVAEAEPVAEPEPEQIADTAAEPVAEAEPASPPTLPRRATRPTDDDIIATLALHYRVHESTVIGWLLAMDLEAASARMVAAI